MSGPARGRYVLAGAERSGPARPGPERLPSDSAVGNGSAVGGVAGEGCPVLRVTRLGPRVPGARSGAGRAAGAPDRFRLAAGSRAACWGVGRRRRRRAGAQPRKRKPPGAGRGRRAPSPPALPAGSRGAVAAEPWGFPGWPGGRQAAGAGADLCRRPPGPRALGFAPRAAGGRARRLQNKAGLQKKRLTRPLLAPSLWSPGVGTNLPF